jgi:protein-S-isoprenylcysteine O-methyltransferase Ste14
VIYIALGVIGFLVMHLFDLASLKRIPLLKPVIWLSGSGLLVYAVLKVCLSPEKISLPLWLGWLGWPLLVISLGLLIYPLFINLPLVRTYIRRGTGDRLVKSGLYALVRHPGVFGLVLVMAALILVSNSRPLLLAAAVWIVVDIALVVIQDRFIFTRMFPGYKEYQQQTPMLVPSRGSIGNFINRLKTVEINNQKQRRSKEMSVEVELFQQGRYQELWQRCCGFIELSIDDFMRIQRRLLLEQLELLGRCRLGQVIMNGTTPESVDEFRQLVPLTTYTDYAPYMLKRRMDVMPKKPILWQCTSGKSGEYPYRWAPITARQLDELEPLMFALLIFASCKERGEISLRGGEKCFYGMAPPPYATGTLTRVFPYDLFTPLPPVEESEMMSFDERVKKGFELALSKGLDMSLSMSSVAVAIGERFSQQGQQQTSLKSLLNKPRTMLRLVKGMLKSKIARRPLMPKDLWSLKGLITFGIDGSVYREKIKSMWGRYPLNFHGCTEATLIAMETWDYQGMTFVPNLNFFEFIPEKEVIRSREDESYQPSTLLMNELTPGNYELVITSLHGGPFIRYRLGHMVKITSTRNEQLGIDIPQMEFISRVDDQIDIAGFTRLSEKIIWEAIEKTGIPYRDWVVRKEVKEEPVLHLYIEPRENGITAEKVKDMVHEQLKKLDTPYAELESFTGLRPLEVTLLPGGAFKDYKLKQQKAGAELAHLKPPRLNPSDDIIEYLVSAKREIEVEAREGVEA